ncbi:MAG: hypothetical protein ACKOSS_00280, partial [Planctomycetia bacterium]
GGDGGGGEVEEGLAPAATPAPAAAGAQPGLAAQAPARAPKAAPARVPEPVVDVRNLPVGSLAVLPLGPDDEPIACDLVTVSVEPGKGARAWHVQPLLVPDRQTQVWSGERIFAGPVKVRVWGDTVVPVEVEAVVDSEVRPPLRVHVDRAGLIEYEVSTYRDEPLGDVTLQLTGAGGRAVQAFWQVRTETVLTQPRLAREAVQGPQGVVFGIPPGTYRLRATSQAGEWEEAAVTVEPLGRHPVALKVRR